MAYPFFDNPVDEGAQIIQRAFIPPAPRVFRDRSNASLTSICGRSIGSAGPA